MAYYAQNNIPDYSKITKIPSGHLPTDINTSLAQDWSHVFSYCYNLTSLPEPFYDTSNATNMYQAFEYSYSLTTIPNFDTSNVTNMSRMFRQCYNLITIPNFDTSNVTNMSNMFYYCWNIHTVPNFNTINVTNMKCMFYADNITSIPNFDTSNVIDMDAMFAGCKLISTIPIFNIGSATIIDEMFWDCRNIKGNLYIESNNVISAIDLCSNNFMYNTYNYTKNIYCHANTTTYNSIYNAMGNNTYNYGWNTYLKTMENDYAEIPWTGSGIYRFPTNKIQIWSGSGSPVQVIEVTPYTDYNLSSTISVYAPDKGEPVYHNDKWWFDYGGDIKFRFFKDITNMAPDIIDTI